MGGEIILIKASILSQNSPITFGVHFYFFSNKKKASIGKNQSPQQSINNRITNELLDSSNWCTKNTVATIAGPDPTHSTD